MLYKDFFRLIIKLFGLYSLVICLFTFLPSSISQLAGFGFPDGLFWILLAISIPILLLLLLIFKADLVIKWLKLDQGFDEELIVMGELNNDTILKLACIFIGGFLLIETLPVLINQIVFAFKGSLRGTRQNPDAYYYLGLNFLKLFLGYYLIRKYEFVSRLLRTKRE